MAIKKHDFLGKEVADAIKEACETLKVPQERLDIEVLETGTTGIFGLIRKKAKIRVSVKEESELEAIEQEIASIIVSESTPRQVVEVLNDVFGICDVITREKHGDIDKFIGDAIMAVFIDAQDAVEASEKILHEALPYFNRLRAEEGLVPIRIRIGVNSGIVLQGDVGTTDRKDLTVIGDVVNTEMFG